MPATGNLDTKATTNSGNIYAARILVDVGGTAASCVSVIIPPKKPDVIYRANVKLRTNVKSR